MSVGAISCLRTVFRTMCSSNRKRYRHNFSLCNNCRSIRSSHILLSEAGRVQLTGLRNCYRLLQHGIKKTKCWQFPTNSNKSIYYYSPEILMQVNFYVCSRMGLLLLISSRLDFFISFVNIFVIYVLKLLK